MATYQGAPGGGWYSWPRTSADSPRLGPFASWAEAKAAAQELAAKYPPATGKGFRWTCTEEDGCICPSCLRG